MSTDGRNRRDRVLDAAMANPYLAYAAMIGSSGIPALDCFQQIQKDSRWRKASRRRS